MSAGTTYFSVVVSRLYDCRRFETQKTDYATMRGHIPEEMSPQSDRCENLKTKKFVFLNWWERKAIPAGALRVPGG